MRNIIVSEFVSADGYIVGPTEEMTWVTGNFNEEMAKYASDLMESMDTILLGRVTYQIMANAWPNWTEEQSPGSDKMNHSHKVVLSKTLKQAPWGRYEPATIVSDNIEQKITELKQKPGKNIVIYGSAKAVQSLARHDLVDEYQLLVHPIFLGGGKPLFEAMQRPINLEISETKKLHNGVVLSYYRPSKGGR